MSSSDAPGTEAPPPGAGAAWAAAGWNRPLSWKLILSVTPRLPRFVLAPLHHLTTAACFACMPRQRAAARRNLARVTGRRGWRNLRDAYLLFWNFSRFMVAYAELTRLSPELFESRLEDGDATWNRTRRALEEGRGVIVLTAHVGHWDLGLKLLSRFGPTVHVVMNQRAPAAVTRYAQKARELPNVRVHELTESPLLAVELLAALRRGEIVAVQGDRPVGSAVRRVPLFGAPTELPTGPIQLAMATGAPILPVFVLLEAKGRFRLVSQEPLRFRKVRGDGAEQALLDAAGRVAEVLESVVGRWPHQWFNFYDIWPAPVGSPEAAS